MDGFGMVGLKTEGAPAHPDYWGIGCNPFTGTDEQYLRQLQAYADYHGIDEARKVDATRPELLDLLEDKTCRKE